VHRALGDLPGGEGGHGGGVRAAAPVADVAADEDEVHVLALGEQGERPDAKRRRMVRDEEDGPVVAHARTCS
jgi:hypothetical protein